MTQPRFTDTELFDILRPRQPRQDPELIQDGEPDAWVKHVTAVVAYEIRHWRSRRNLSAQQLSERCIELGYEVPRNVITNLENGRRHSVALTELIIIAAALNVPPVLLIYPLGDREPIRTLPRVRLSAWDSLRWFIAGDRPRRTQLGGLKSRSRADALREWEEAYAVVELFRRHDELVARYLFIREGFVTEIRRNSEPEPKLASRQPNVDPLHVRADAMARDMSRALAALDRHRTHMRKLHLEPPILPASVTVESEMPL